MDIRVGSKNLMIFDQKFDEHPILDALNTKWVIFARITKVSIVNASPD